MPPDDRIEIEFSGASFRLNIPANQMGSAQFANLVELSGIYLTGGVAGAVPPAASPVAPAAIFSPPASPPQRRLSEPPAALPVSARTAPATGPLRLPESADLSEGFYQQAEPERALPLPKSRLKPAAQRAARNWLIFLFLLAASTLGAALALRFDLIELKPRAAVAPELKSPGELPPLPGNPQAGQNPTWPQTSPKPALGG